MHRFLIAVLILAALPLPVMAQVEDEAPDVSEVGNTALATRLQELAAAVINVENVGATNWFRAAVLLEMAARLDKSEPQYSFMQAEALLKLNETDLALAALQQGRQRLLAKGDRDDFADLRYISIILQKRETPDEQLQYLLRVADAEAASNVVRAYAAARAAQLYKQKLRGKKARELLRKSLELNPYDIETQQFWWEWEASKGTTVERISSMLAQLRCTPYDTVLLAEVARESGKLGLNDQAIRYWQIAMGTQIGKGEQVPNAWRNEYAVHLYQNNLFAAAVREIQEVLNNEAINADAWIIGLAMQRAEGTTQYAESLKTGTSSMYARLQAVRKLVGLNPPVEAGKFDLSNDVEAVLKQKDGRVILSYINVLTEVAWFECYFVDSSALAEQAVQVLKRMQPKLNRDLSQVITRLEGWILLQQDKKEAAAVKLSAVESRDVVSALGMVLISKPDDPKYGTKYVENLLKQYRSGVANVLLLTAVKGRLVDVPMHDEAAEAQRALQTLPAEFFELFATEFTLPYRVRLAPKRVAHRFAEPLVAHIEVRNTSKYPLTIRNGGAIGEEVWFSAQLRGAFNEQLGVIGYERLSRRRVLMPGETLVQRARLDQGTLRTFLRERPIPFIAMKFACLTNVKISEEKVTTTIGGRSFPVDQVVERVGLTVSDATMQRMTEALDGNNGDLKLWALDSATALATQIGRLEAPTDQDRATQRVLLEIIARATSAKEPSVRAWARYLVMLIGPAKSREAVIAQCNADLDWQARALPKLAWQYIPQTMVASEINNMQKDKDETVKRLGRAIALTIRQVAEEQQKQQKNPTTQPAPEGGSTGTP